MFGGTLTGMPSRIVSPDCQSCTCLACPSCHLCPILVHRFIQVMPLWLWTFGLAYAMPAQLNEPFTQELLPAALHQPFKVVEPAHAKFARLRSAVQAENRAAPAPCMNPCAVVPQLTPSQPSCANPCAVVPPLQPCSACVARPCGGYAAPLGIRNPARNFCIIA